MPTAEEFLRRARAHLERVQVAWLDPTNWDDLVIYGFYCLEASVMAAAAREGTQVQPNHSAKALAARDLAQRHGIPDVSALLGVLNTARKAAAYGDTPFPTLDAEQLATDIEAFVEAAATIVGKK